MTEQTANQAQEMMQLALAECQATVRGYDTKAQIVGVGYIFALEIIFQLSKLLPSIGQEVDLPFVVGAWAVMIFPIALFGFVLYPTRKSVKHLKIPSKTVKRSLYLEPERYDNLGQYIEEVKQADINEELAHELFKISSLRELKRNRFLRALFSSGLAFVVLFAGQVARVLWNS